MKNTCPHCNAIHEYKIDSHGNVVTLNDSGCVHVYLDGRNTGFVSPSTLAGRALRSIPSEKRAEASRVNGLRGGTKGGRPKSPARKALDEMGARYIRGQWRLPFKGLPPYGLTQREQEINRTGGLPIGRTVAEAYERTRFQS